MERIQPNDPPSRRMSVAPGPRPEWPLRGGGRSSVRRENRPGAIAFLRPGRRDMIARYPSPVDPIVRRTAMNDSRSQPEDPRAALRRRWLAHAAAAFDLLFDPRYQDQLVSFDQREQRAVELGRDLTAWP